MHFLILLYLLYVSRMIFQLMRFLYRWNGNSMTLLTCNGTVLASDIGSTFYGGDFQVANLCLEVGLSGLIVEVGGGSQTNEVSWIITFPSGNVEGGGAGSWTSPLCISPSPSHQPSNPPSMTLMPTNIPSVTSVPTVQPSVTSIPTSPACEFYTIDMFDGYGDG